MIVRAHNRVRIRRRPTERHSIGILFGPKNAFYKIGTGDLSGTDPRWIPTFGTTSKGSRSPNRLVTNQAMPSIREFYNWDGFGTTLWISAFSILNSLLGDQPSMGVENTLDRIRASLPQRSFTGHPLDNKVFASKGIKVVAGAGSARSSSGTQAAEDLSDGDNLRTGKSNSGIDVVITFPTRIPSSTFSHSPA